MPPVPAGTGWHQRDKVDAATSSSAATEDFPPRRSRTEKAGSSRWMVGMVIELFLGVDHGAIDASMSVVQCMPMNTRWFKERLKGIELSKLGQPCAVDQTLIGKALMLYLRIVYCAKRIMGQNRNLATQPRRSDVNPHHTQVSPHHARGFSQR